MQIPDAVIISAVGVLGGVLGFLVRAVIELRTRVAILEHRTDATTALEAKIDRLDQKIDDLALKLAAAPLNRGHGKGRQD